MHTCMHFCDNVRGNVCMCVRACVMCMNLRLFVCAYPVLCGTRCLRVQIVPAIRVRVSALGPITAILLPLVSGSADCLLPDMCLFESSVKPMHTQ